jgi:hypothetical protein
MVHNHQPICERIMRNGFKEQTAREPLHFIQRTFMVSVTNTESTKWVGFHLVLALNMQATLLIPSEFLRQTQPQVCTPLRYLHSACNSRKIFRGGTHDIS